MFSDLVQAILCTQFMAQAAAFINGKKIGLLQGAGTHFVTWFYSMHQLLWQKAALKATMHYPDFTHLTKNYKVEEAVKDIENEVFWKALYFLLYVLSLLSWKYCGTLIR